MGSPARTVLKCHHMPTVENNILQVIVHAKIAVLSLQLAALPYRHTRTPLPTTGQPHCSPRFIPLLLTLTLLLVPEPRCLDCCCHFAFLMDTDHGVAAPLVGLSDADDAAEAELLVTLRFYNSTVVPAVGSLWQWQPRSTPVDIIRRAAAEVRMETTADKHCVAPGERRAQGLAILSNQQTSDSTSMCS